MIGGEALLRTLVASGVDTCFMNPGTSEMHFVAALDAVPEMRGVLALFEGVATGAADGYARMTGRPAAVLLHLGPGLGNGVANLHNARRAWSPVVAVVGDHATYHKPFDAQLESDIETVARNVSPAIIRVASSASVGVDAAAAVAASTGPPGRVATLILPADLSWSDGATVGAPVAPARPPATEGAAVATAARALRSGERAAIVVGSSACRSEELRLAASIAASTGAPIICETFPARLQRGAGLPAVPRLAYLGEMAAAQLQGVRHLILVGAKAPVSFFAYPGKPSRLAPEDCELHQLSAPGVPSLAALDALAGELAVAAWKPGPDAPRPAIPSGELTLQAVSAAIGALLPEGAIVSDESNTSGLGLGEATAGAPPHDWLTLTGGAIGQGLPAACGAATACPDRKVVALQADGSALYTFQALWTMARESLDVVVVLYNNRSYAILNMELQRTGAATGGTRAKRMLDLSDPDVDFVALASGLGVPAQRATTADDFAAALGRALAAPGPALIEVVVPTLY
ncbi:acetolactate synthase large subunit [Acidiferrimicrobium sp. IK]|uniref:acetolactate synthase large subunit n=1 Tax=Acidiferrimicrobium sp. IK TaxID=2871700 RepID=UPI0021CB9135|nr:acetolactate synthase large subunit [Acidiferrimicrobium sp. IK]MCU4183418.1 acetolactate synthase large subunit [Acidiferrimicrobium sp. IK]